MFLDGFAIRECCKMYAVAIVAADHEVRVALAMIRPVRETAPSAGTLTRGFVPKK